MLTTSYVTEAIDRFRHFKGLGDDALAQTADDALFIALDPLSNSIAVIVKHLHGNMRARWTECLNRDGKKPDRDRDAEFDVPPISRAEVMELWDSAWKIALASLGQLTDADLAKTVSIGGNEESVMQFINRQMAHCAYHVGQIVFLAKHFAGPQWKTLSVPRGQSKEYLARVRSGEPAR